MDNMDSMDSMERYASDFRNPAMERGGERKEKRENKSIEDYRVCFPTEEPVEGLIQEEKEKVFLTLCRAYPEDWGWKDWGRLKGCTIGSGRGGRGWNTLVWSGEVYWVV